MIEGFDCIVDCEEDQLGALGLVTNAVVLWNTLYMQEALSHLGMMGETPEDEHIARLSPLMHGHILIQCLQNRGSP